LIYWNSNSNFSIQQNSLAGSEGVNYKLLTPGPLTTTSTVKEEMLFDRCAWDDDYKIITQKIR
jgi:aspartate aminotransferase-like enzyme